MFDVQRSAFSLQHLGFPRRLDASVRSAWLQSSRLRSAFARRYPWPVSDADRTLRTFRLEQRRAVVAGMLEAAGGTFLLLIAVTWFKTGATAKSLVAAGGSVGLLATPLVVAFVERMRWPSSRGAARLAWLGAATFLLMALMPVLPVFVLGSVLTMACGSAAVPLLTQMYQDNYPERERGRLFSRAVMIRIASAALFSYTAGRALTQHLELWRWLMLLLAAGCAYAGSCLWRCPSSPLRGGGGAHPFRGLRYARADRLFRRTLICWMLMGFANLMMLPLRVEYLANEKYRLALTISQVALFTGVIPNVVRLVMSPLWGHLFDRMNFFVLRVTLNIGFALGILAFFTSDSSTGLVLGAVLYGISNAGGDVAWSLWVTKFSPPDRVADYMAVHTFFTGVRGVIAPVAAFHLINHFSVVQLGWFCAGLILLASLLLLPEIRFGRGARPAPALVEEVSE